MAPMEERAENRASKLVEQETEIFANNMVSDDPDVELISATKVSVDTLSASTVNDYFGVVDLDNVVIVRKYSRDDDAMLQELRPRFVIMYEPSHAFVRHIEVYRSVESVQLQVYFMMYTDSVEEHMYLGGLRREKDAFEKLISQKGTMVLPFRAGSEQPDFDSGQRHLRIISSRVGGGQKITEKPPTVIVDTREFRADLPITLHSIGINVVPRALSVGDYVLSPEMCVERKSLDDLVKSFNDGRLYEQCERMSTHYEHPILLIEFEAEQSFTLQSFGEISGPVRPLESDIQSKLVMLVSKFRRLNIIWSSSPSSTADIFMELKQIYDEPDPAAAAAVGQEHGGVGNTYNSTPVEMLRKMPGVTSKNYSIICSKVKNMHALCHMSSESIQDLIGIEPGRKLYAFLHKR
ncbi:DNA repair protein RAD16 [Malassezia cuniculi]|uniref:DNA repair protein RAD16 n=1 Tax=Malassezia cuniculi TaxID=948313 RepID=A0AAF0J7M3_9BASI|nr:DNA repair protein RAD16 [Malassezia cuniculi]